MDLRDILRIFFSILALCSSIVTIIGFIKVRKALKGLSKQQAEVKIVDGETEEIVKRGNWFIFVGTILAAIFEVVAILILHRII
jgi:hypothetical protein